VKRLTFLPLTLDRWTDLETLFGANGACGGCWCMAWRLPRAQWQQQKGEKNRRALKRIVSLGRAPGLLAYSSGAPVGWCCIGPREDFPALARSRVLAPVDDEPVWSIVCFFIARPFRGQGVSVELLKAAAEYAREQGARIVEGYPLEPGRILPAPFVWTGLASAFRKAGFREVLRRSPKRPIMRRVFRT
jgi:GNAT superfamily N-acetyltransferase